MEELTSLGNLSAFYTRAGAVISRSGASNLYYHGDGIGSVKAITVSGVVSDAYDYDAWGNKLTNYDTTQQPYQYVGQLGYYTEADVGLDLLGVRYYDPEIGRFITQDPIGDGMNWYAYVDNDPINMVDPYGLSWAWYDSLSNWVSEKVEVAKDYYSNNTNWVVAGAINTAMDVVTGPAHAPSAIGHLGEGAGTFWAEPTLENAGGAAGDVATFTGTIAGTCATMSWARNVGPTVEWKGGEIVIKKQCGESIVRINPTGNRGSDDTVGRRPHYHRRIVDSNTGKTVDGGGIGKHRPWEKTHPKHPRW